MTDAASSRPRRSAERPEAKLASAPDRDLSPREKRRESLAIAEKLFEQRPDWLTFFREMVGVGGVIPTFFPTSADRAAFELTDEYAEIQRMMKELRGQAVLRVDADDREPTRVITVRLPKSMHQALQDEAATRNVSMNKLCISKLLKALDDAGQAEPNATR